MTYLEAAHTILTDAGDTAAAAAMCTLVILASLSVRALYLLAARGVDRRARAWRMP